MPMLFQGPPGEPIFWETPAFWFTVTAQAGAFAVLAMDSVWIRAAAVLTLGIASGLYAVSQKR